MGFCIYGVVLISVESMSCVDMFVCKLENIKQISNNISIESSIAPKICSGKYSYYNNEI